MKHLLSLGLLFLLSTTNTWSQDTWVKVFGGSGSDWGSSVTKTSDGGVLITGGTQSNNVEFEETTKDTRYAYVIKLDKDGRVLWKKTFGGSDDEYGSSITTTLGGDILVTGTTSSNDGMFRGMNRGQKDVFVIKLNKDGDLLWTKTFGGSGIEQSFSVTTTVDNEILITGGTLSNDGDFEGLNKGQRDVFVFKLDNDGNVKWRKTFGGEGVDDGLCVSTTSGGGVLITGMTQSIDGIFKGLGKGGEDVFVIKLNKDGDLLWTKTFGGTNDDLGYCINTMSNDILITGWTKSNDGDFDEKKSTDNDVFVMKLNKNGDLLWKKTLGGTDDDYGMSISRSSGGDIIITGETRSNNGLFRDMNKGGKDVFVVILDKGGKVLGNRTLGGSGNEVGLSITTTTGGRFSVTGWTSSHDGDFNSMGIGGGDVFVVNISPDVVYSSSGSDLEKGWGHNTWVKMIGGSMLDGGRSVTTSPDGGTIVTGYTKSNDDDFNGLNRGDLDIFVVKHNVKGKQEWIRVIGGSGEDLGMSITRTQDGGFIITGETSSSDGDFQSVNDGNRNIVVVRLDKRGNIEWNKTFGGSGDDGGNSIISTRDGGVIVLGSSKSNDGDFKGLNRGDWDIVVLKLDKRGNIEWNKTFGGSGLDVGKSIIQNNKGGFVITGSTSSNDHDFQGMNYGERDMFLMEIDHKGRIIWKKTIGGSAVDGGSSIIPVDNTSYVVTGSTGSDDGHFKGMNKGSYDIFMVKFDLEGEIIWRKTFGGTGIDEGISITSFNSGGLVLTGETWSHDVDFRDMGEGYNDLCVIRTDGEGNVLWNRTYGGKTQDGSRSVTNIEGNTIVITGYTSGGFLGLPVKDKDNDILLMILDDNGSPKTRKTSKKR